MDPITAICCAIGMLCLICIGYGLSRGNYVGLLILLVAGIASQFTYAIASSPSAHPPMDPARAVQLAMTGFAIVSALISLA